MRMINCHISTIFFDAGGVLFDTEISRSERIRRILKSQGFNDFDIEKGLTKGEEFSNNYLKDGKWLKCWEDEEMYWDKYYEVILKEVVHDFTYSLKK